MITYENFIVPNNCWKYVLEQHRTSFINEYYKKHKNYPSEETLQNIVLTTEEKERYKRIFYARYCVTGTILSEPNIPSDPIIPPTGGSGDNSEQEKPDTPMIDNDDSDYVICTYNIATSGGAKLYRYRTDRENYIEKIIYDGKEITPFSANTSSLGGNPYYACYDFGKLGDVTVKYKLKEGTTSMDYVWFGDTRITEIVIPSCITTIQNDYDYGGSIFSYTKSNNVYLTKIVSLKREAPILKGAFLSRGSAGDSIGTYQRGTLYVPKDCAINYTSWMGDGITDNRLADIGWLIKELDY